MTDRELMQQWLRPGAIVPVDMNTVRILITALRERLAQPQRTHWEGCEEVHPECRKPEQEPVAHVYLFEPNGRPRVAWDNANGIKIGDKLYTAPPQRKPLSDEEIERACVPLGAAMLSFTEVARAIEAAHGIKGEA
jgi:hypothetical protein